MLLLYTTIYREYRKFKTSFYRKPRTSDIFTIILTHLQQLHVHLV